MSAERLLSDDLLDPISPELPAGEDLRWLPDWDRIKEARQNDDGLSTGQWTRRESRSANWRLVQELASALLKSRSKDLQLALWWTEANVKLHGFPGLRYGLNLVRELMIRYWDAGLYPLIEDGPEDRGGPFEWLNEKLADSVLELPMTRSSIHDRNYSLLDLRDARLVGSESNYRNEDGDEDPQKKREFEKALANGRISLDLFARALASTVRVNLETLATEFREAHREFKDLEKVIDDKFGDVAPSLSNFRSIMNEIEGEVSDLLEKKRKQEPNASPITPSEKADRNPSGDQQPITLRFALSDLGSSNAQSSATRSWSDADRLIRAGQIDQGLAEMTRLAAAETTGRSRFERRLLLAEVCLGSNRDRLARAVLEELAEQVETHHLDTWESSELIGGVWTRLYQVYKRGGSSDSDEAAKLYDKLCRLDPWQALQCGE